mmetsp:Transcript_18694/g.24675  ORF Transcript_18694/g.24675 Transcript_18694/m.24675 type:complete len:181 (-) Transcript_18694:94-636(-)
MSGSEASDASVSTKTSESESNSDLSDSENDFEKQEIDKSGEVQEEVRLKDITQIEEISSLMDIFRARLQMRFPAQKFEDLMPPPPNQDVKLPPSSGSSISEPSEPMSIPKYSGAKEDLQNNKDTRPTLSDIYRFRQRDQRLEDVMTASQRDNMITNAINVLLEDSDADESVTSYNDNHNS